DGRSEFAVLDQHGDDLGGGEQENADAIVRRHLLGLEHGHQIAADLDDVIITHRLSPEYARCGPGHHTKPPPPPVNPPCGGRIIWAVRRSSARAAMSAARLRATTSASAALRCAI